MSISNDLNSIDTAPAPLLTASQDLVKTDPHETFLRTKTFSSLNGVRCLCCLAVIKAHVIPNYPEHGLFAHGSLGVDLFFGISGFLIVTLLIRERERRGTVSLGKFYARRTLRIFPIYYLMIFAVFFVYLAVSPWRPDGLRYYAWTFPVLLTYTQDIIRTHLGGFFHCWSLAMEEQFYLFWPTVEKFVSRAWRWGVIGGLLLLNQAVNFGLFDGLITRIYGDPEAVRLPIFLITFTPILLGVLLAYLLNSRTSFGVLYRVLGYRWSPFLFLAMLIATCEVATEMSKGWPKLAVHLTLVLLLGSLVVREDHFARPILTFPPLARIGVISYGVYLYHVWVIVFIELAVNRLHLGAMNLAVELVLVTIATIAVAEASFRLIEQPLLRLKERFHS
jgi:peptidoglycan/LPS O-acetylase OafA/YrhL